MKYNADDFEALSEHSAQAAEDERLRAISRRTRARMVLAKRRGYATDLQLERSTNEDLDIAEEAE